MTIPCALSRRAWDRWFMMASIGAAVGFIGYLMFLCISIFSSIKFECMYWLVSHAGCVASGHV